MLLPAYISYFENLAVSHKDIRHITGADPGAGKTRFATYTVDDVIAKSLRTKIGFPALLLEIYEWEQQGENFWDAKTMYTGAFTILDHASAKTFQDELRASATAERIMQDMVQRLWSDHNGLSVCPCDTPFQYLNINGNCVAVGPLFDNEFGWRFEFTFRPKNERNLYTEPDAGTFL